jgi:hypothetical protein
MEDNGKRKRRDDETQPLIERCKAMEKELEELKRRMVEIQRRVENELKRRNR